METMLTFKVTALTLQESLPLRRATELVDQE
jgi:hypothetical protein